MDDANEETQTGNTIGRTPAANAVGGAPAGNAVEATPAGNTAEAAPADTAGEVRANNAPGASLPAGHVEQDKSRRQVKIAAAVVFVVVSLFKMHNSGLSTVLMWWTGIIPAYIVLYWWSVCRFAKHQPKNKGRWVLFIVMLVSYLLYAITFVDIDDGGNRYGFFDRDHSFVAGNISIGSFAVSAICSLILLLSTIPPKAKRKQLSQERKQSCEKDAQIPWDKRRPTYIVSTAQCKPCDSA